MYIQLFQNLLCTIQRLALDFFFIILCCICPDIKIPEYLVIQLIVFRLLIIIVITVTIAMIMSSNLHLFEHILSVNAALKDKDLVYECSYVAWAVKAIEHFTYSSSPYIVLLHYLHFWCWKGTKIFLFINIQNYLCCCLTFV